jgi:hypothetical protein
VKDQPLKTEGHVRSHLRKIFCEIIKNVKFNVLLCLFDL